MPDDPYADSATGILRNKLGLSTSAELSAAAVKSASFMPWATSLARGGRLRDWQLALPPLSLPL